MIEVNENHESNQERNKQLTSSHQKNNVEILEQFQNDPNANSFKSLPEEIIAKLSPYVVAGKGDDGYNYVTICHKEITKTLPLRSKDFKYFIIQLFKSITGKLLRKESIERTLDNYDAEIFEQDNKWNIANRVKYLNGSIYYDLHNSNGDIIKIDQLGWEIITPQSCPIKFPKRPHLKENVHPIKGASLDILRPFMNVATNDDFILICSVILNYFYRPPYPLLGIIGQQGSSKSTLAKLISEIVDPSLSPITASPRDEREIFIMAKNSHLLNFDNLSGLSHKNADTFCRLVTGAGFRTRELYTDNSENIIYTANPIIGNGIDEISHRGDLISRMVQIRLPSISPIKRKSEDEFWKDFYESKPLIMGAIFDALSIGLKNLPTTTLNNRPRMADFAIFASATSEALNITPDDFMNAYSNNIDESNTYSLDFDPISVSLKAIIQKWPDRTTEWTGTMTDLLKQIKEVNFIDKLSMNLPSSPQGLSRKLNRLIPLLPSISIGFEFLPRESGSGRRLVRLYRLHSNENIVDADNCDNYDDEIPF
jgi:hypothetical protein